MSHDRAAVPTDQPASIKVPDQLQQSNRPNVARRGEAPKVEQGDQEQPGGGVLHELKTQRAHD